MCYNVHTGGGNCSQTRKEIIAKTEHNYIESSRRQPTYYSDGSITYKCTICSDTYSEKIPKLEKPTTETHATPVVTENITKAHNWTEWQILDNATCSEKGKMTRRCNDCGEFEYASIPVDKNAHTWSDWKTTKKSTIFKNGVQTRECYLCHSIEKKDVDKLKAKVTISKKSKTMSAGETFTLKIKKKLSGDKIKSFKSSNKKVATVSKKGKIKALKKGTATITLTMKSGCTAKCKIKVK